MSVRQSFLVALLTSIVCLVPASSASAAACSVRGKERKLGATYVTSLRTTKVSCASAERVVKSFHACRRRHGAAGRCTVAVRRFRCTEVRGNKIPTQYDAKVTCRRGSAKIVHAYTQYT